MIQMLLCPATHKLLHSLLFTTFRVPLRYGFLSVVYSMVEMQTCCISAPVCIPNTGVISSNIAACVQFAKTCNFNTPWKTAVLSFVDTVSQSLLISDHVSLKETDLYCNFHVITWNGKCKPKTGSQGSDFQRTKFRDVLRCEFWITKAYSVPLKISLVVLKLWRLLQESIGYLRRYPVEVACCWELMVVAVIAVRWTIDWSTMEQRDTSEPHLPRPIPQRIPSFLTVCYYR